MPRATLTFIAFACLHVIGVFVLPGLIGSSDIFHFASRNWGYHFLAYYPTPVVGLAYVFFAVSLIPAVQDTAVAAISHLQNGIPNLPKPILFLVISVTGVVILWFLRQKYPFLGDGHVRSAELDSGVIHTSGTLYIKLLGFISSTSGLSGRETYQITSTLLGLPFIFLTLCVVDEFGSDALSRVTSTAIIACSGLVQLYAGYVEVYAPLPVLILLATWFGIRAERHPANRYASIAVAFGSVAVHPLCAIQIPASLYLFWRHDHIGQRVRIAVLALLAVVGATVFFALGAHDLVTGAIMPVMPSVEREYAILTATNFWERLNGILLCVPALFPLLLLLRGEREIHSARYLMITAAAGIITVFSLDFVLGSMDWDLMALMSFPLCLLLGHRVSRPQNRFPAIAIPAIAITILNTLPWLVVNHVDASISRYEDIAVGEPGHYFASHDRVVRVALALRAEGKPEQGAAILERQISRTPEDTQTLFNLAAIHIEGKRYKEAISPARSLLRIQPWNVYGYLMLRKSFRELNSEQELNDLVRSNARDLITSAERAYGEGDLTTAALAWGASAFTDLQDPTLLSRSPRALDLLIDAYTEQPNLREPVPLKDLPEQMRKLARRSYQLGSREDAILFWRAALQTGLRDAAVYQNLGVAQLELGDSQSAESTWREGLRQYPEDTELIYSLAVLLSETDRPKEAVQRLREAIELAPDSVDYYIRYGALLESQGDREEAVRVYQRGLARVPQDSTLLSALKALDLEARR